MVVHGFPPRSIAGTELHNFALAQELSKRHKVFVYAREVDPNTPDYSTRVEDREGLRIRWVNYAIRKPWGILQEAYLNSEVGRDFESFLEETQPDVVHVAHTAWLSTSIIETASAKKPVVLQLNDFYYLCDRIHLYDAKKKPCAGPETGEKCGNCISLDSQPYLKNWNRLRVRLFRQGGVTRLQYMKKLLTLPRLLIAPSAFVKQKHVEYGVAASKILLSPYGIKPFTPLSKYPSEKFRFGYLGHLFEHKGVLDLVEAFRRLPKDRAQLDLYGTGETGFVGDLKKRAAKHNVNFKGTYQPEMLPQVLAELDAVVVPSTCHESYSFAAREAMAAGLPVITSNLPAQSESVTGGVNGLHFDAGDPRDLAEKMAGLLTNEALYRTLSDGAKGTACRTIEDEAEFMEAQYAGLVKA